jgi:hypothetical protein
MGVYQFLSECPFQLFSFCDDQDQADFHSTSNTWVTADDAGPARHWINARRAPTTWFTPAWERN